MAFRWRTIVATLIFSLAAGILGSRLGIQRAIEIFPGPVSGGINLAIKQAVHGSLELSDQQKSMIAEIEQRNDVIRIQLRADAKQATLAFARAMNNTAADRANSPEISAALDQMSAATRALSEQAVIYADQIRSALTPAQRTLVDDKINQILLNTAERT